MRHRAVHRAWIGGSVLGHVAGYRLPGTPVRSPLLATRDRACSGVRLGLEAVGLCRASRCCTGGCNMASFDYQMGHIDHPGPLSGILDLYLAILDLYGPSHGLYGPSHGLYGPSMDPMAPCMDPMAPCMDLWHPVVPCMYPGGTLWYPVCTPVAPWHRQYGPWHRQIGPWHRQIGPWHRPISTTAILDDDRVNDSPGGTRR